MKCPFCGHNDNKVVDSRVSKNATVIRRRRQCQGCSERFTTYERVEELETYVVKKDGSREALDRNKILQGMKLALHKRPVSMTLVEEFLDSLVSGIAEQGRREIPAAEIGEKVVSWLRGVDQVAYVRFASVYHSFRGVAEFQLEVEKLQANGQSTPDES